MKHLPCYLFSLFLSSCLSSREGKELEPEGGKWWNVYYPVPQDPS